jgi:hypothetical protein
MIFFKKKNVTPTPKQKKPLQEAAVERVQTAEGWRRKVAKKGPKAK